MKRYEPLKPQTTRKPSWVIEDLAWKIQVKTPAHKTVLAFLAKQANDSGRSYAGYQYMLRACSIGSKTTMSRALRALKDLGILMWVQGGGGEVSDTNTYTLSLAAMRRVVKEQGVFDMETGKLIRQSKPSPVTVPAFEAPTVSSHCAQPSPVSDKPSPVEVVTESSAGVNRVQSLYCNPLQSNPLQNQPSGEATLWGQTADSGGVVKKICSDGLGGVDSTDKTDTTDSKESGSVWKDVVVEGVVRGRLARVSDLVKTMTAIKPSPIGNDEVSAVK